MAHVTITIKQHSLTHLYVVTACCCCCCQVSCMALYTLGSSKMQFLSLIETIWRVYFYKKKKTKHTFYYLIISNDNNNNNHINNIYRWLSSSLKRNIINLSIATRLHLFFFLHFKLSVPVHCGGTYHLMCVYGCVCVCFLYNYLVMILFPLFSGWSFGSVNNTRMTFYMYERGVFCKQKKNCLRDWKGNYLQHHLKSHTVKVALKFKFLFWYLKNYFKIIKKKYFLLN